MTEQVTSVGADAPSHSARIMLADSALHAPQAGFGGHEFYPELLDTAAVLVCRLTWTPLPDGNKRAAWASLAMFLDLNDVHWDPDRPQVDEATTLLTVPTPGRWRSGHHSSSTAAPTAMTTVPKLAPVRSATPW